eukprot:jgi/Chlat1/6651/Chrsp49S06120
MGVAVGYALTEKKALSFIRPELIQHASSLGVQLIPVDPYRSLSEQGPFDIILHKLPARYKTWVPNLESFMQTHPDVIVVDSPAAIRRLGNRQSMLQSVNGINLREGKVGVPRQLVLTGDPAKVVSHVGDAGLTLPVGEAMCLRVVKPLISDGSAVSHELAIAYDHEGLANLNIPCVLQEFVNHGGVLFKVYVVGEKVTVVRRRSLPDVDKESERQEITGLKPFSRISSAAETAAAEWERERALIEIPPQSFVTALAAELRLRLGLHLFNLDLIRDIDHGRYYVIDINYFPGYAKMPAYAQVFGEFLSELGESRAKLLAEQQQQQQNPSGNGAVESGLSVPVPIPGSAHDTLSTPVGTPRALSVGSSELASSAKYSCYEDPDEDGNSDHSDTSKDDLVSPTKSPLPGVMYAVSGDITMPGEDGQLL